MANYSLQELVRFAGAHRQDPQIVRDVEKMLQEQDPRAYAQQQQALTQRLVQTTTSLAAQGDVTLRHNGNVWLLQSPVVQVQLTKHIVTTPLANYQGTVKEAVSEGDWQISLQGILCAKTLSKPLLELKEFMQMVQEQASLAVYSEYLHLLGIQNIVLTQVRFPHSPYVNVLLYQIDALSDRPFELQRKKQRELYV